MNNVSIKKGWMTGMTQPHADPPSILIIKGKNDEVRNALWNEKNAQSNCKKLSGAFD